MRMNQFQVTPPEKFSFKNEDWPKWMKRFERFRVASGLDTQADENQVNALIYTMGEETEDILVSLHLTAEQASEYDTVKEKLDAHFIARRNVIFERAKSNQRQQEMDNPQQIIRVPVYIRVLDVNDNAPTFATNYETFVCENAKANQRIQTISATDPDDPLAGHRFFFGLAQEAAGKANFSLCDNKDNTAGILTRRNSYSSLQKSVYHVPVVISDEEFPMQSSTNTLTIRVCTCDREGNMKLCNAEALTARAGLSTGALVAILLCVIILLKNQSIIVVDSKLSPGGEVPTPPK
ncbi:cadherin-6-like isoform X2 [Amphiprion ocellaris]|uniref:cadherin-6-like isoform X2 n=1 Tax=Amphiprion ocellaris TaxID=80972 RepID=UPI002410C361|nr:cadherin-6-like isoform X2 [Amphiprion ocellaris]XP_054866331.1 cadherin-6-like isoform X2 [Amphiprion ocellaris]